MSCATSPSVTDADSNCASICIRGIKRVPEVIADLDDRIGSVVGGISLVEGKVGQATLKGITPIGTTIASATSKTALFIKRNWQQLLAYIFAWGFIVTCTGLMYGFEAVALPLTIGLGCGFGFGVITGILMVKVFDPDNKKFPGKNTLWDLLNLGIGKLDPNGTRQIVLAVAVTVMLAAAIVFPYVIGAVFGVFIGNQLATKAGHARDLGSDPLQAKYEKEALKLKVRALSEQLKEIQSTLENAK